MATNLSDDGVVTPGWQAHNAVGYDSIMKAKCGMLLEELVTDSSRRHAVLTKPHELHRELFTSFAPPGFGEYAGTYRGTQGTSLAGREISSRSTLNPQTTYPFCPSGEVPGRMSYLLKATQDLIDDGRNSGSDYQKLVALAYAFCWIGKIHPFLDGNGHIQRAIFAAMATEFGYPLSPRFAIHQRPYDCLLALALEVFTTAPSGKEDQEIALTAEYLGFFLDGPFNAPRTHIGTGSLYT